MDCPITILGGVSTWDAMSDARDLIAGDCILRNRPGFWRICVLYSVHTEFRSHHLVSGLHLNFCFVLPTNMFSKRFSAPGQVLKRHACACTCVRCVCVCVCFLFFPSLLHMLGSRGDELKRLVCRATSPTPRIPPHPCLPLPHCASFFSFFFAFVHAC